MMEFRQDDTVHSLAVSPHTLGGLAKKLILAKTSPSLFPPPSNSLDILSGPFEPSTSLSLFAFSSDFRQPPMFVTRALSLQRFRFRTYFNLSKVAADREAVVQISAKLQKLQEGDFKHSLEF